MKAVLPADVNILDVDIWFEDEMRVGQRNTTTRIWALKGSQPRIVRQQQSLSVYLFGAVCPAQDQAVGFVLRYANKEMMAHHLSQISQSVPKGRHAVLVVDQATFHKTDKLICPDNISLLFLPPYAPELNPVENLWAQLRQGWLANRCFEGYDAIVQACCEAWNAYTTRHNAIKKLCSRKWATIQN